jgi:hypothetical protein
LIPKPPKEPKPPREPLGKKVFLAAGAGAVVLLIALGLIAREYVLPFSGPLAVEIDNRSTSQNPLLPGHLTIKLGEEVLGIPRAAGSKVVAETTWSSGEPISALVDSRFSLEKDTSLIVDVRDLGFTGSDSGQALELKIKITDSAITLSLESPSGAEQGEGDLASVAFARGNLNRAVESCYSENAAPYLEAVELSGEAYRSYVAEVAKARLDGTRTLLYSVWASRSASLVRALERQLSDLEEARVPISGAIANEHNRVTLALISVISAWENFNSVSRRESDSQWDAAWDRIYGAETDLTTSSGGAEVVPEVVRSQCREDLLGG